MNVVSLLILEFVIGSFNAGTFVFFVQCMCVGSHTEDSVIDNNYFGNFQG